MRSSDWSSDVCSSDLLNFGARIAGRLIISRTTRCGWQGRTATRGATHLLPLQKGCGVPLDRSGACRRFEDLGIRSEEHTSELQSLMRISYAVFCLKKKKNTDNKKELNLKSHT